MTQWDVNEWRFPHGQHPCVIISPSARCQNPDFDAVNILACSSQRNQRTARVHEFILDTADGLDWETLVRCDFIFVAKNPN